jgi:cell pole-organizing protein PopZ
MGSMERAPEPTMEEILASIRRIISDDEAKAAESSPASSPEAKTSEFDADADTKIIDDIARVLSGAAPAESGSEDDDILDLTKELSELQAVADETAALPDLEFPAPARMEVAETIVVAETEIAQLEPSVPEPVMTMPEPPVEEPSALDLAIAELRAREQARMTTAVLPVAPEPEPVFEPLPEPVFDTEPEAFDEAEPELVLTTLETETVTETFYEPEPVEPLAASPAPEPEMPSWLQSVASSPEPEPVKEPEPEPAHINGNGSHAPRATHYSEFGINTSGRSLEDSVKEMLRPLLREWLDEHMSRVLEAALRDELKDAEARWQRNEQRRRPY